MRNTIITFGALALLTASCAVPEPLTLDAVAHLDRQEQIAAVSEAAPEDIDAIYHEHLARISARPDLPAEDRATLARIGVLLTPESYERADGEAHPDDIEAERLARTLSLPTLRRVATLGGE